jgi:hypothetical protein
MGVLYAGKLSSVMRLMRGAVARGMAAEERPLGVDSTPSKAHFSEWHALTDDDR